MLKNKKNSRKKIYLVAALVLIVFGLAGAYFLKTRNDKAMQTTSTGFDVNLRPPTAKEKEETEANKKRVVDQSDQTNQATKDSDSVSPQSSQKFAPFITYAGPVEPRDIEVTGYVSGVIEEGGTCEAVFSKGTLTLNRSSSGIRDSQHTTCPPITLPRSEFPTNGKWQVILKYSSPAGSGASQAKEITI
jgi:hypothetical protein